MKIVFKNTKKKKNMQGLIGKTSVKFGEIWGEKRKIQKDRIPHKNLFGFTALNPLKLEIIEDSS